MDFKGINTEAIEPAKEIINTYVTEINQYLTEIKDADAGVAFRGKQTATINAAIDEMIEEVRKPLIKLQEFEEKLEKAKQSYITQDESITA